MEHVRRFNAYVTQADAPVDGQEPVELSVFDADGSPLVIPVQAAAQADTTAVDLAALKVDFNALLAKLRTAGVIATS